MSNVIYKHASRDRSKYNYLFSCAVIKLPECGEACSRAWRAAYIACRHSHLSSTARNMPVGRAAVHGERPILRAVTLVCLQLHATLRWGVQPYMESGLYCVQPLSSACNCTQHAGELCSRAWSEAYIACSHSHLPATARNTSVRCAAVHGARPILRAATLICLQLHATRPLGVQPCMERGLYCVQPLSSA